MLDELPEFARNALEALRQPMESGWITVSRERRALVFPAKFTLIAAMNPCPCGYYGDTEQRCKCSGYDIEKYQRKISGPLLDRIDLQVKVGRVKIAELRDKKITARDAMAGATAITSPSIKAKVEIARRTQRERHQVTNAEMTSRQINALAKLDASAERFLETLERPGGTPNNKPKLSPRGYYRLLKVARTIADLDENEAVTAGHLAEAYSYRLKEG